MAIIQSIILGFIQGTTEFLPISSSAHLVLVPWIFGWDYKGLGFDTALHFGTAIAIVAYFWKDWVSIIAKAIMPYKVSGIRYKAVEREIPNTPYAIPNTNYPNNLLWQILIASIPAAIAGYFLSDYVEKYLHSPILLAINLAVFGIILWLVDLKAFQTSNLKTQNYNLKTDEPKDCHPELVSGSIGGSPAKHQNDNPNKLTPNKLKPSELPLSKINYKQSLIIGLSQILALVPGVSRSGITMTAGRSLGMNRESSARFSFILSAPITVGAFLFEAIKVDWTATSFSFWLAIAITVVVGLLTIKYLLKYLQRGSFVIFTVYRIILAIIIIVLFLFR